MIQNYQQHEGKYGAQSNPYGGGDTYGTANPYGGSYDQSQQQLNPLAPFQRHGESNYSQPLQYSQAGALSPSNTNAPTVPHTDVPISNLPTHGNTIESPRAQPLSQDYFFAHIRGAKVRIGQLNSDIKAIASIHQRMLSSPDNRSRAELEEIVTNTQIRNTQIMDKINSLERDAVRDPNGKIKRSQVESLKRTFKSQLEDLQKEEANYSKRYREDIGRQYRIINPDATDAEVEEMVSSDLGDEGIFTQALKFNRIGQAASVLGAVHARHNDIQRIEKTMSELALLFTQLNEQVTYQDLLITEAEVQTVQVEDNSNEANHQLSKAIKSAKRARRRK
ncbi:t-SNARE [Bipolaris maydis]|nr:t-SNARE [Bipolaris maydis]KAJ6284221.1 t-SNARE [Bipolaris maydis]